MLLLNIPTSAAICCSAEEICFSYCKKKQIKYIQIKLKCSTTTKAAVIMSHLFSTLLSRVKSRA